jgi:hypothetical protein
LSAPIVVNVPLTMPPAVAAATSFDGFGSTQADQGDHAHVASHVLFFSVSTIPQPEAV